MKNLFDEAYSQFINISPKNWTQTDLTRFLKIHGNRLELGFLESKKEFNSLGEITWQEKE